MTAPYCHPRLSSSDVRIRSEHADRSDEELVPIRLGSLDESPARDEKPLKRAPCSSKRHLCLPQAEGLRQKAYRDADVVREWR
jgi:hypothetical protein